MIESIKSQHKTILLINQTLEELWINLVYEKIQEIYNGFKMIANLGNLKSV